MLDQETRARYEAAKAIIHDAGALAKSYFDRLSTLTVKSKGPQDVVSEADLEVELMIKKRIADAFPGDAFFGEETGASEIAGARGIWVVDPIDGTQPFVSGMTSWCVSIAFLLDGRLRFGLVYNPVEEELFAGADGEAATLNGAPISLHRGQSLKDGIVSVGYSTRVKPEVVLGALSRLLHAGGMFHRNGSGALCLCYVACGRVLGYVEPHINAWDCLGAIAVIQAAGGRVNDYLTGDALRSGNRIVAAPPAVFDALDAVLG
jgi:myo-inositol-1(or 4)-monophosphatase